MLIYFIEPTPEGLLTAFYHACRTRRVPDRVCDGGWTETSLECETAEIETDCARAESVLRWLGGVCGEGAVDGFFLVWSSGDPGKSLVLLRYLLLIFRYGEKAPEMKSRPEVIAYDLLERQVGYEEQRLKGFVRFRAANSVCTENGETHNILYGAYRSDNDLLCRLASYFADRNSGIPFVLHDIGREKAALFSDGELVVTPLSGRVEITVGEGERDIADLFRKYFSTVTIATRKNSRLQRAFLPLRYREMMLEFEPEAKETLPEGRSLPEKG